MSERRSGRSRKQVDYAKFEADNDDDFASPTPPPPKKKKMSSEKGEGRREKEKPAKVTSSDKPTGRKERLPLDEKLYERDLQAALEMSLQESDSQPDKDEEISRTVKSHAILHSTPLVDLDHAPTKTVSEDPEESQSIMPSAIPHGVTVDNNIEFLGTVNCSDSESSPPGKRRAAARSKRKSSTVYDESTDDDEEFGDEDSSESDSDFNDADSDFDDGKVKGKSKRKAKGKAAPKQSKASAAGEKKHRTATKCNSKAPSAGQAIATAKSAVSSTAQSKAASSVSHRVGTSVSASATPKAAVSKLPSAPHKTPVWTPPGRSDSRNSGSGATLKSPSSGLRLGLSRHARIKPLHPSLKVS